MSKVDVSLIIVRELVLLLQFVVFVGGCLRQDTEDALVNDRNPEELQ